MPKTMIILSAGQHSIFIFQQFLTVFVLIAAGYLNKMVSHGIGNYLYIRKKLDV